MAIVITTIGGRFIQTNKGISFYKSSWLTSNVVTQFAHGLGAVPDKVQLWYDDNGTIIEIDSSNISSIDTTNINIDFSGLTIDATHKLKIIAYYV